MVLYLGACLSIHWLFIVGRFRNKQQTFSIYILRMEVKRSLIGNTSLALVLYRAAATIAQLHIHITLSVIVF